MSPEEKIKLAQLEQQLHVIKSIDPERYNRIMKSYREEIQKARAGFYKDTPENRKLGRVGRSYGIHKELEEKSFKTVDRYFKNGKWSSSRVRGVHFNILDSTFKDVKPAEGQPTAILIMGGTASGKGTATESIKKKLMSQVGQKFAELDVDEFKKAIPEYKKFDPSQAANNVHKESSHLGNRARKYAVDNNMNLVNDGTFSDMNKAKDFISKLKKKGYKIHLINVSTDIDEAKKREAMRAERTGRKVPVDVLESSHIGAVDVYNEIKGLADDYSLFDNNVPHGSPARLIDSKEKGVIDKGLFNRFQSKKNYKRTT